jgi:hypothetical protein
MWDMTIKEKARIAWEKDLLVRVYEDQSYHNGRILWLAPEGIHFERDDIPWRYDTITDIRFVDEQGEEEAAIESFTSRHYEELKERAAKLEAENAELKRTLTEPVPANPEPEQHDIVKERWDWTQFRIVRIEPRDHAPLLERRNATDAHMQLAAAAPELADMMRDEVNQEVNQMASCTGRLRDEVIKRIHLLRKLGVPNVAPWYKGAEQEQRESDRKWKKYRESFDWGPDGWPVDTLTPPT